MSLSSSSLIIVITVGVLASGEVLLLGDDPVVSGGAVTSVDDLVTLAELFSSTGVVVVLVGENALS